MPWFELAILTVAVLSGATASIVGFGIGSLLTPLLATRFDMPTAVAAVTLPHALATALRCWRLRDAIDGAVLRRFGVLSAVGGLLGALGYAAAGGRTLTLALGALLLLTAGATLAGLAARWHPQGPVVWLLGLLSGGFGGLAGNQGGLRAAAMGTFGLSPRAFVATATATGLLVDAARTPVYAWHAAGTMRAVAGPIAIASVGVLVGTLLGERVLVGVSPERYRRMLAVAIGLLGAWLVWRAMRG